jgi:pimeloyl-ACP methyl ester carboxylesterase
MATMNINGVDLAVDIHGEGETSVVLVCGTGQPAAMWGLLGTVGSLVDAGFRVVTFDNRGIPPSACPRPPYSMADMALDAIGVIEATCAGPVHLVGASLGANIVHTVAHARPDLLRSASMVVGGVQFAATWVPVMRASGVLYDGGVEPPADLELFTMMMAMLPPGARGDDANAALVEAMASGLTTTFGPGGRHGHYSANLDWISGGDARTEQLAQLTVPAQLIAHEHDPVFALATMQRGAALIPNGRLVTIPGVSHVALDPQASAATSAALVEWMKAH